MATQAEPTRMQGVLAILGGRNAVRIGLVSLAALGWLYAFVGTEGVGRQRERLALRARLQAQLADERTQNERLSAEVAALRSDPFAIEQAIRAELDYQRPGELVVHVADEDPLGARSGTARNSIVVPPPITHEAVPRRVLPPGTPAAVPPGSAATAPGGNPAPVGKPAAPSPAAASPAVHTATTPVSPRASAPPPAAARAPVKPPVKPSAKPAAKRLATPAEQRAAKPSVTRGEKPSVTRVAKPKAKLPSPSSPPSSAPKPERKISAPRPAPAGPSR